MQQQEDEAFQSVQLEGQGPREQHQHQHQQQPQPQPAKPSSLIQVTNPEKHGEGLKDAYVTFDIVNAGTTVKRRYQDFCWLSEKLKRDHPSCILPPLPDRHSLLDMLVDRFSPDFIKKRQLALERFLKRLSEHPVLSNSEVLQQFMTKDYLGVEASELAPQKPTAATMLINSPTVNTILDCFPKKSIYSHNSGSSNNNNNNSNSNNNNNNNNVAIRQQANLLERHFNSLARAHNKLIKGYVQVAGAWQNSAAAFDILAQSIDPSTNGPSVKSLLARMASVSFSNARHYDLLGEELEYKQENVFQEYSVYLRDGLKGILKDWEENSGNQKIIADKITAMEKEREYILGTGSSEGTNSIASFLSNKMDQLKGVDPITSKQQRIQRIDSRIEGLKQEAQDSSQRADHLASSIHPEYTHLLSLIDQELAVELAAFYNQTLVVFNQDRANEFQEIILY